MQLLGLSLPQLGLLLTTATSITVGLYLLRQRRRRVNVPFIGLWEALLGDRQSSRLFARLKHLLSLLLALLIVLLLALSLGDPRPRAETKTTRHTVLLIDAGVTMQASDVPRGRIGAARELGRRVLRGAGSDRLMLVAQMDESTTPLSPMTDDPRVLDAAVAQVAASDLPTNSESGYRFALDVLKDKSRPELVVISDGAPGPAPQTVVALQRAGIAVSFLSVGRRGDDVGISAFAVRRYPLDRNRSQLLVELYSGSSHPEQAQLTLLGDGEPIDVQPITLAPGATVRRVYDDVTGVSRTLEARLRVAGDHDDLAANDRAYAVLPARRRTRVLCVTAGNRYLEAALLLDEYLDVEVTTPAAYTSSAGQDVVIFDNFVPARAPTAPALYIRPAPGADRQMQASPGALPLAVAGELEHPTFTRLSEHHPVLRFTALRDVNVARALLLRPQPGDDVVAADPRGPLIIAGRREGLRFVALAFDIRASDLPLRVAWPLLLLNTIDWFVSEDHDYISPTIVGEPVIVRVGNDVQQVSVRDPDGRAHTKPATDGALVITASQAGFVRVALPTGERWYAFNLSTATRRDLRPVRRLQVGARTTNEPLLDARGVDQKPFVLLLLAACVLLVAEWVSFHRRWTV
jgi:hypothetical protein